MKRKDPGNPQRPLTAYSPGHPDERALQRQAFIKMFIERSDITYGEVSYLRIIEILKDRGYPPKTRVNDALAIAEALEAQGIKIIR